jgi:hypothetical protein
MRAKKVAGAWSMIGKKKKLSARESNSGLNRDKVAY